MDNGPAETSPQARGSQETRPQARGSLELDEYFDLVASQYLHLVRAACQRHGPGMNVFEFFVRAKPTGENCRYQYCERGGRHWEFLAKLARTDVLVKYVPETTALVAVTVPVNSYNSEKKGDVRLFDRASGARISA